LIEDSAFGQTGLMFAAEAERLGVPVLTTERLRRGDLDVRAQLTRIQSLGATHLQFWGYYAEYALVARQMREAGFSAVLMGNQAPVNDKTIELGGAQVEGALNICLFVPGSTAPAVQAFTSAYQRRFGALPDTWAAQSYDGMKLLAEALRRGGLTRPRVRDALAATRDFIGVTGVISFGENGDASFRDTSIVTVSGGRWIPYQAASGR
jgi:branched-chain amino acid transport system substrate-binding protein